MNELVAPVTDVVFVVLGGYRRQTVCSERQIAEMRYCIKRIRKRAVKIKNDRFYFTQRINPPDFGLIDYIGKRADCQIFIWRLFGYGFGSSVRRRM